MSDEEQSKLPTKWKDVLASSAEGGLPQLIAGPAGKAISRLIGAAAEIPAAWLEQKSQAIKDETEARSKMMKVLSEKAAELGLQDEKLLARGLDNLLGRAFREQQNREAVAVKVIEQLSEDPASSESEGPSEDWLNVFEQYAAKATSDELRETWARVLAGEIRSPKAFSLKTLQFISVLDKHTADAAEFVLSRMIDSNSVLFGELTGYDFILAQRAREAGLIGQLDLDTTRTVTFADQGYNMHVMGDMAIVAYGTTGETYRFHCTTTSQIAAQLYPVVRPKASEKAVEIFIDELKKQPAIKRILKGRALTEGAIRKGVNLNKIWEREV